MWLHLRLHRLLTKELLLLLLLWLLRRSLELRRAKADGAHPHSR